MGTFTYSPLTDGTLADVADINTPMAAISTVLNGGIDSTNITPASITPASLSAAANPETRQRRNNANYVVSGGTIATSATLSSTITAMVAYNNGKEQVVGAFPFTVVASKDTYIYEKDDGTYITTNSVANNAASPTATTNTDGSTALLVGIVISSATAITTVNQGQPTMVLPIASSVAYSVTDSLGNLIYPTSPQSGVIGYRQIVGNVTATTIAQATGLSCPVIVPAGRKVKISIGTISITNSTANASISVGIWDGTVGVTQLMNTIHSSGTVATDQHFVYMDVTVLPNLTAVSSKTYNVGIASSGGTVTLSAAPTAPAFIKVELV